MNTTLHMHLVKVQVKCEAHMKIIIVQSIIKLNEHGETSMFEPHMKQGYNRQGYSNMKHK
jgi:hypothetical protein